MKKKLLSLVMATAMILALAAPAFAAGEPYYADGTPVYTKLDPSITFNAVTFVPTISLTLPALQSSPVVLNPYKIEFSTSEHLLNGVEISTATGATTSPDWVKQVISPVYAIKNHTDAALKFTVSATTTVADSLNLVQTPVEITESGKKAHIALVIGKKEVDYATFTEATAPYNDNTYAMELNRFDSANYEVLELKKGEVKSTSTNMCIAAAPGTEDGEENYLVFQFQGDMARTPNVAWEAADSMSTVVKFTFTPKSAEDFTVAADNALALGEADVKEGADAPDAKELSTMNGYANMKVNATTPSWAIVSSGAYDAITLDATNAKIGLDLAKVKANISGITSTAADKTDVVVLSFKDENGVPRTVELAISFSVVDSTTT